MKKKHFPSVLQDLSKLFWRALGGKAAIPATGLQRGQQEQSMSLGCVYIRLQKSQCIWHPFYCWRSSASTPGEAWCCDNLHGSQGVITGLYLHREGRALGNTAPGAPGGTPGLGSHLAWEGGWSSRGRGKEEPCVWASTSANLWNQILQFLGYLHLQNGCKNEWILFCQVLVVLVKMETIKNYVFVKTGPFFVEQC